MKRGVLVAAVLVAALTGCSASAGDGNLMDDWAVMAEAKPKVPPSGVCYQSALENAYKIDVAYGNPVPCAGSHAVETFHVGTFPAEVALLPSPGSADYWRAYDECETKAREFLGDDWFNGRLHLNVIVPVTRQWDGGGRWFRCELIEVKSYYLDEVVTRTSSLQGGLSGQSPLAQRCGTVVGLTAESWGDITPVDCNQSHDVEYTGSYKIPGVDWPDAKQSNVVADACWDVVARYLGGSRDGIQVGYLSWTPSEDAWKSGDHWLRCYAWGDKRKIVGSVKGIGNSAPRG